MRPLKLIFLPGAGGHPDFWRPMSDTLRHIGDHVLMGWPGFGGIPAQADVAGMNDLVDMVVQQMDAPCALIAQSMGGVIAMKAALARPEAVTHLVLSVTSGGVPMDNLGSHDWRPDYFAANPDAPRWFGREREDLSEEISGLDIPTLLLWGDRDPISPVAVGQRLHALLKSSQLHVVAGGEHDLAKRHAATLAPLVMQHLLLAKQQPLPTLQLFQRLHDMGAGEFKHLNGTLEAHLLGTEALLAWLLVSRGIRCDAGQVIVVSGSQQALDLVGRILLDPGDEVLVEDPGYQGIRASLMGHGAVARPVPLDADGMDIAHAARKWPKARMAVVTPSWQFPAGVHMGLGRRLAVLAWARQHQAWVVEDDYDGEFQYLPHRTPALSSLDETGRTIHVGTFSKSLHPGLRIGFIVVPDRLVDAFTAAKVLADRHNPALEQTVLARFIADGHLLRHLQRMRALYAERQQTMIDALSRATHGAIQLLPSLRGIHLVHEIPAGADDASLVIQAKSAGVHLVALSAFCMASPRRGWALGYAAYDAPEMQKAAKRLARLIRPTKRD